MKPEEQVFKLELQAPFFVDQYKHLEICASHSAQFTVNEPTKDTPDEHGHHARLHRMHKSCCERLCDC